MSGTPGREPPVEPGPARGQSEGVGNALGGWNLVPGSLRVAPVGDEHGPVGPDHDLTVGTGEAREVANVGESSDEIRIDRELGNPVRQRGPSQPVIHGIASSAR